MNRRNIIKFATVAAGVGLALAAAPGYAQTLPKLRVGLMLPFSGTFAALGTATVNGFKLFVEEKGGKLAGREIEYFTVDDESDPAKGVENATKLVKRDKVDVLVGTIHSGVALAMAKVARDTDTLLLIPNAGADELTGPLCSSNVFRISATNWQPSFAMGKVMADRGHKNVITLTWKYAAGEQSVAAFKEAFEAAGGKVNREMYVPFPDVEFQAYLAEIARLKPDAVYAFLGGAGAAKLLQDYHSAGLKDKIPLYGPGYLTEGNIESQKVAAQGVYTTLHYGDGLPSERDQAFREAYRTMYKNEPDVYALQGYDSAMALYNGLAAVKGDTSKRVELLNGIQTTVMDSPRGSFKFSSAHNPTQDIYLRVVEGDANRVVDVAVKNLADPAKGCKL